MAKKYSSKELDNVYHALSNSTRRRILTRLAREGSFPVSSIAKPFNMSLAAVSKHIKVLEKAGLLTKEQKGTTYYCRPTFEPIRSAGALVKFFEQFLPPEVAPMVKEKIIQETMTQEAIAQETEAVNF